MKVQNAEQTLPFFSDSTISLAGGKEWFVFMEG
jgi:hypothetical protein